MVPWSAEWLWCFQTEQMKKLYREMVVCSQWCCTCLWNDQDADSLKYVSKTESRGNRWGGGVLYAVSQPAVLSSWLSPVSIEVLVQPKGH